MTDRRSDAGESTAPPVDADDRRTVVVGLDGADRRILDRLGEALPALSALRSRGVDVPLRSTHPPTTASAWPSVYTGVGPPDHGVHGFFAYEDDDPRAGRVVDGRDVAAPALWEYCAARGVGAAVLNAPVAHPAGEWAADGAAVVPGFLAPPGAPTHPPELRERLDDAVDGDYRIYPGGDRSGEDRGGDHAGHEGDRTGASEGTESDGAGSDGAGSTAVGGDGTPSVDALVAAVEDRRRAAVELLSAVDWRLAVVVVQATDTVCHDHPRRAAIDRVYRAADRLVGAVVEAVPDGTGIVVCSDHGMRRTTRTVHVNELLADAGLLAGTGDPPRRSIAEGGEAGGTTGPDGRRLAAAAVSRAGRSLLGVAGVDPGAVPARVARVAERGLDRLGGTGDGDGAGSVGPVQAVEGVDWDGSAAFCRTAAEYGVRINLAGREPDGRVAPGEYDRVRSRVIAALRGARAGGGPAFSLVDRHEAIRPTAAVPAAGDAPDVVVRPAPGVALSGRLTGRRTTPAADYDHRPEGVFIAADGPFEDARSPEGVGLPDVAPVALASLGLPVPDRTTGSVPTGLLDRTVERESYDLPASGDRSGEDGDDSRSDRGIERRLDDLGYL